VNARWSQAIVALRPAAPPFPGLEWLLGAAVVQEVLRHALADCLQVAAGDDLEMLDRDPSRFFGIDRDIGRGSESLGRHGSVIVPDVLMIATPPATFTVPDPLPDAPAKGPVPPRIVCVISWNCGFPGNPKPM
jgi:hypothetical protein